MDDIPQNNFSSQFFDSRFLCLIFFPVNRWRIVLTDSKRGCEFRSDCKLDIKVVTLGLLEFCSEAGRVDLSTVRYRTRWKLRQHLRSPIDTWAEGEDSCPELEMNEQSTSSDHKAQSWPLSGSCPRKIAENVSYTNAAERTELTKVDWIIGSHLQNDEPAKAGTEITSITE